MIVGVPREIYPEERRVAMVPAAIPALAKAGCEVMIEKGAGMLAGFPDAAYVEKGAKIVESRAELFAQAGIIVQILCHGANDKTGREDLPLLRRGQALVGFLRPLGSPETVAEIAATGATAFAIELMPRITRSQSMDALSAMATICGYKAVIMAADALPRLFPMLTTAAGTIAPARVFVLGAGVAGLQAISTARRLGAIVSAYDVRAAAKEQILSVGGRAVELPIEAQHAEDTRGYAQAQDESFYRRQREVLGRVVAESDVVICTAVVPGRRAPMLVTGEMVKAMQPGSVIVDLAAERGGNCELTHRNQVAVEHGVTIMGLYNLAETVPYHASQMYARNMAAFIPHLLKDGNLHLDPDDQITRDTLVTRDGEVVHKLVLEALSAQAQPSPKDNQ
jgi:proton-translocating NAD(P)+ transhydrogenase subunit alpha